jgi:hypothetical protein
MEPGTGGSRYNPSYSGGRNQDSVWKPAWVSSSRDPISKKKKKSQKKG